MQTKTDPATVLDITASSVDSFAMNMPDEEPTNVEEATEEPAATDEISTEEEDAKPEGTQLPIGGEPAQAPNSTESSWNSSAYLSPEKVRKMVPQDAPASPDRCPKMFQSTPPKKTRFGVTSGSAERGRIRKDGVIDCFNRSRSPKPTTPTWEAREQGQDQFIRTQGNFVGQAFLSSLLAEFMKTPVTVADLFTQEDGTVVNVNKTNMRLPNFIMEKGRKLDEAIKAQGFLGRSVLKPGSMNIEKSRADEKQRKEKRRSKMLEKRMAKEEE